MKKLVLLFPIFLTTSFSFAQNSPYKPHPIILIHGYTSGSGTWGAPTINRSDSIPKDSISSRQDMTYYKMLQNFIPIVNLNYNQGDKSYTISSDPAYPNKTFLEVINFDYACGSIDADEGGGGYPPNEKQVGWGNELRIKIKEVLTKYYGSDWGDNPEAKVILIAHSMGGLATREAIYQDATKDSSVLKDHIELVITSGTPHLGTPFMNYYGLGEIWTGMLFYWVPGSDWVMDKVWSNPTQIGWKHFCIVIKDIIGGLGMGEILSTGLFDWLLHKYTDAGRDMGTHLNPFMNSICSEDALKTARKIPYKTIVSAMDYPDWADAITWGCAITQAAIYGGQFRFVEAALKLTSAYMFFDWANNSDGAVRKNSQTAEGLNLSKEIIGPYNRRHEKEPENFESFVQALETPPVIYWNNFSNETEGVIKNNFDNGQDRIEVNLGQNKPDTLNGKIDDYFLANCKPYWRLNFGVWDTLSFGNSLGTNGNNFFINLKNTLLPGWNKLDMKAKNTLGEWSNFRALSIFYNPYGTSITFLSPQWDSCFNLSDSISFKIALHNIGRIQAETLVVTAPDTQYTYIHNPSSPYPDKDTLFYVVPKPYVEGIYQTHLYVVDANKSIGKTEAIQSFYVDVTAPVCSTYNPKTKDSLTYSPYVTPEMPIVFNITDNFDSLFGQPKNVKIAVLDSWDTLVWDTTLVNCYYNVPKTFSWNFLKKDGDTVLQSGAYKLIVSVSDKARNTGTDTSIFFIDTEPPHINLISALQPNPFVKNSAYTEFAYTTNEHTELKVRFINLQDTSDVLERTAYGDSIYYPESKNGQDTCLFIEGGDYAGAYLHDGIYKVEIFAKDDAGNDTIIENPLGVGIDTLRVDKTAPEVYDFLCSPWTTGSDGVTKAYFTVSDSKDNSVNYGRVKVRIYLDDVLLPDSFYILPNGGSIKKSPSITLTSEGTHTIKVQVIDSLGNYSEQPATAVKNSIGTMIGSPVEGENIYGTVAIKGISNDPNMTNPDYIYGFEKYELWWRKASTTGWQASGIEVPESRKMPGSSNNVSNKFSSDIATVLGYWNTTGRDPGNYNLLLISYEDSTGVTAADTITVNISAEQATPLQVDTLTVSLLNSIDTIFEPTKEETLKIKYQVSQCANVDIDIVSLDDGEKVFHKKEYNIVPYEGIPSIDTEGFYLYNDGNKWWLKCKDNDTVMTFYQAVIKGISPAEGKFTITDTTGGSAFVEQNNILNFNCTATNATGEMGFTTTYKTIEVTFKKDMAYTNEVYLGAIKAPISGNPLPINIGKIQYWYGQKSIGGFVKDGNYKIKVSAEGINGKGFGSLEDTVNISSDFNLTLDTLTSNTLYPDYGFGYKYPVGLTYTTNTDARITIDVCQGGNIITRLRDSLCEKGALNHTISWDGRAGTRIAKADTGYRFKVYALHIQGIKDTIAYSNPFEVKNDSIPVDSGSFIIPNRYITGYIHSGADTVYDGKSEYLWDASASGNYYPPQPYTFIDTAWGNKNRYIQWKIAATCTLTYYPKEIPVNSAIEKNGTASPNPVTDSKITSFYIPHDQTIQYKLWAHSYRAKYASAYASASIGPRPNVPGTDTVFAYNPIEAPATGFNHVYDSTTIQEDSVSKGTYYIHSYAYAKGAHEVLFDWNAGGEAYAKVWYNIHTPKDYRLPIAFSGDYTYLATQSSIVPIDLSSVTCSTLYARSWGDPDSSIAVGYNLIVTIDGIKDSVFTSSTDTCFVTIHGVTVIFRPNTTVGEVCAVVNWDSSYSKWDTVATRTDTCFPNAETGGYLPDTTWMADIFTKPTGVPSLSYSTPHSLSVVVDLHKEWNSDHGDSCIIATIPTDNWVSDWNSQKDPQLSPIGIFSATLSDSPLTPIFTSNQFQFKNHSENPCILSTYYPYLSATNTDSSVFWWDDGDSSNPYLHIETWNVNLKYINGDTNKDVISDSIVYHDRLSNYLGHGVSDYLRPKHILNLDPYKLQNTEKGYIPIYGASPDTDTFYQFSYYDGKNIYPISDTIQGNNSFGPLAYLEVSKVCGKIQLIMSLLNQNGNVIGARTKEIYVGSPIVGDMRTAHSFYYRAQLRFPTTTTFTDTVCRILPVNIAEKGNNNIPYISGPAMMLFPKGIDFGDSAATVSYSYTGSEITTYGIDRASIGLFAINEDGVFQNITSKREEADDNGITIFGQIFRFPETYGAGYSTKSIKYTTQSMIAALDSSKVATVKPLVFAACSLTTDSMVEIHGEYAPNSEIQIMVTDSLSNIYGVLAQMPYGNKIVESKIDTTDSLGNFQTTISLVGGSNIIYVMDRSVVQYVLAARDSGGTINPSWKRAGSVGRAVVIRDLSVPHIVVVPPKTPQITDIFDEDTLKFYSTKQGRIYYTFLTKTITFEATPYETLSVTWNGKDDMGNFLPKGNYPYTLTVIDIPGNKSTDTDSLWLWQVNRGVPVVIDIPQDSAWLTKNITLKANIDNGADYPITWEMFVDTSNSGGKSLRAKIQSGYKFACQTVSLLSGRSKARKPVAATEKKRANTLVNFGAMSNKFMENSQSLLGNISRTPISLKPIMLGRNKTEQVGYWATIGIQEKVTDTLIWDSRGISGKNIMLRASATDPYNNTGADTVTVNIDNIAPICSLLVGDPKYLEPDSSHRNRVTEYKFNETGTTVYDISGKGNNGTFSDPAPTRILEGKLDECLRFDSTNYVTTINNLVLAKGTIEFWFKTDSMPDMNQTLASFDGTTTRGKAAIGIDQTSRKLCFKINGTTADSIYSDYPVTGGFWHLIDAVWGANGMRLYVNGALQKDTSVFTDTVGINGQTLKLGPFCGYMDEFKVFDRELSGQEVLSHNNVGLDSMLYVNTNTEFAIHASVNDSLSGLKTVRYRFADTVEWINYNNNPFTLSNQKYYTIYYSALDSMNNEFSNMRVAQVDTTPPKMWLTFNGWPFDSVPFRKDGNTFISWGTNVAINTHDSLSGVKSLQYGVFYDSTGSILDYQGIFRMSSNILGQTCIKYISEDNVTNSIHDSSFVYVLPSIWCVQLKASTDSLTDNVNYAGVETDATDGFDVTYDKPDSTSMSYNYLNLYFAHQGWGLGDTFKTDIRHRIDLSDTMLIYAFEVKTDRAYNEIEITATSFMPEHYGIYIVDLANNAMQDMRAVPTYKYSSDVDGVHKFELWVGKPRRRVEDWTMISVPVIPTNLDPKTIFGEYANPYYLYNYSQLGSYQTPDSVKNGFGYWMGVTQPCIIDALGAVDTTTRFVPLEKNCEIAWNLVGCPFYNSVWLDSVKVQRGGTVRSMDSAAIFGWVQPTLYTYISNEYIEDSLLSPWQGYWFPTLKDSCTLQISRSYAVESKGRRKCFVLSSRKDSIDYDNWMLTLNAKFGKTFDNITKLGVKGNATEGFDNRYD
ncbi:MAG: LamG-like jellyroll fold domain-containing protein, partial [bacterium]